MKIVHVYAKNLQIFVDAVKDTDCRLNASQDINYLTNSLQNFNARDVLGLVIFANPITKKCLNLIRRFDNLFSFKQMPIIIISDNANELYRDGYFRVKNSLIYLIDSEDNSISDVEMSQIFTTLLALSGNIYDLSCCTYEQRRANHSEVSDSFDFIDEQREDGCYRK